MVYVKKWSDFESAAVDLYAKSPRKTRYSVKFVQKTGQLVLKMTDDTRCIKYKTFSAIVLNRFESLNLRLLSQISNTKQRVLSPAPVEPTPETTSGAAGVGEVGAGGNGREREGTPAPSGQGAVGTPAKGTPAGGKKKKKGKK